MNVLVDTSVWSEAFRRAAGRANEAVITELKELIDEQRAVLIGPVRQEILSGIKESAQFSRLRNSLRAFPDFKIEAEDYEEAAQAFDLCRAKGVQGSNTDFLICAVAQRHALAIFTLDNDFQLFSKHLKLRLHDVRGIAS